MKSEIKEVILLKKRKKKLQNKDPFEHLHAYENIITHAFKSSIEQGNPAALKFMKEQNSLKKAEEKKRREA